MKAKDSERYVAAFRGREQGQKYYGVYDAQLDQWTAVTGFSWDVIQDDARYMNQIEEPKEKDLHG